MHPCAIGCVFLVTALMDLRGRRLARCAAVRILVSTAWLPYNLYPSPRHKNELAGEDITWLQRRTLSVFLVSPRSYENLTRVRAETIIRFVPSGIFQGDILAMRAIEWTKNLLRNLSASRVPSNPSAWSVTNTENGEVQSFHA